MAPTTNRRVIFAEIPVGTYILFDGELIDLPFLINTRRAGVPQPGKTMIYDTSHEIDLEHVPLNGGVLIRTLDLSIDPFMRGRMRQEDVKSYVVCVPSLCVSVHRRMTMTFVFFFFCETQ